MAKNQAEIDVAKDINRNSKKTTNKTHQTNQTKPRKTLNIKYFDHQESAEVGLSHGEGRMEIITVTLSPK